MIENVSFIMNECGTVVHRNGYPKKKKLNLATKFHHTSNVHEQVQVRGQLEHHARSLKPVIVQLY